ncbi:hypothetical protein [Deinococcus yavapaiensis]|uniref:CRISPR-associated protein Cas2 n=1 Tax=Deinococcus yavapaiensis KR-236 TaxID=694435 RepID=A0A318SB86_9DEIO|nr:hypothetical protein [Deinococcus yavapaiensis]PYE54461.1 hypothetical protein DES52_10598 [Deinococcus yavapaiensis KR-236]
MAQMYMISYDLKDATSEEYQALFEALKLMGSNGWAHVLESTWLIACSLTTKQLQEQMKETVGAMRVSVSQSSRWVITPIRLSEARAFISTENVEWWRKAASKGF